MSKALFDHVCETRVQRDGEFLHDNRKTEASISPVSKYTFFLSGDPLLIQVRREENDYQAMYMYFY